MPTLHGFLLRGQFERPNEDNVITASSYDAHPLLLWVPRLQYLTTYLIPFPCSQAEIVHLQAFIGVLRSLDKRLVHLSKTLVCNLRDAALISPSLTSLIFRIFENRQ